MSSLHEQIACVRRELRMREHVYRKRVANGQMIAPDAQREIGLMTDVLETLERLREQPAEPAR